MASYRSVGSVTKVRSNDLIQGDHEKSLHRTNSSQITRHCCTSTGQTVKHLRGYRTIILYDNCRLPVRVLFRHTVSAGRIGLLHVKVERTEQLVCVRLRVCVCLLSGNATFHIIPDGGISL